MSSTSPLARAEIARRLPRPRLVEDEVAIEELLPLLHLALEDRAQIVLIADDVAASG